MAKFINCYPAVFNLLLPYFISLSLLVIGSTAKTELDYSFMTESIYTFDRPALRVFAADLDGDLDLEVLVASGDCVYWFENTGHGVIRKTANTIHCYDFDQGSVGLLAADLDNDGDMDVVASEM